MARNHTSVQMARIKPPALRPGDTVGIVAPASNIQREPLEAGCRALEQFGYSWSDIEAASIET